MPADSVKVRVLFVADVIARPGLDILTRLLPGLIQQLNVHLVIANGENGADDARGLTREVLTAYTESGVDVVTSGNHIWDKAPLRKELSSIPNLIRPLNYPQGSGGQGVATVDSRNGFPVTVINLQGRTYLPPIDCPFRVLEHKLKFLSESDKIIFVDFHAESTAEKQALARHFDGKVSAVIGTHTHVQTADEQILTGGTGYITDAGMTGPFDSVIGMATNSAIKRFLLQTPQFFVVAKDDLRLNGVLIDIDAATGKCVNIERIKRP